MSTIYQLIGFSAPKKINSKIVDSTLFFTIIPCTVSTIYQLIGFSAPKKINCQIIDSTLFFAIDTMYCVNDLLIDWFLCTKENQLQDH